MPNITDFLLSCGYALWGFLTSGWLPCSILFAKFVFPKLIEVFKRSIGR